MDALSKADVFRGRIRRWQHWRFLVYQNALMTAGVALAKQEKHKQFISYKRSTRILEIWKVSQKNKMKKAIASKIASQTHTSTKQTIKNILPYISVIFKKNKQQTAALANSFDLDKEEVEFLKKL